MSSLGHQVDSRENMLLPFIASIGSEEEFKGAQTVNAARAVRDDAIKKNSPLIPMDLGVKHHLKKDDNNYFKLAKSPYIQIQEVFKTPE